MITFKLTVPTHVITEKQKRPDEALMRSWRQRQSPHIAFHTLLARKIIRSAHTHRRNAQPLERSGGTGAHKGAPPLDPEPSRVSHEAAHALSRAALLGASARDMAHEDTYRRTRVPEEDNNPRQNAPGNQEEGRKKKEETTRACARAQARAEGPPPRRRVALR